MERGFLMPQSQDYKRIGDFDTGLNTGGMGSIAPVNILSECEINSIHADLNKIVSRLNYKGILYAGLMKTENGIYFLECNCRIGDPEAQVLLSLLDEDLFKICVNCIKSEKVTLKWLDKIQ